MNDHSAPLVGRRDVLNDLRGSLDAIVSGQFRLLALVGEPGAGKTRLLAELERLADAQGCLTLWGRAAEFEQVMPFSALVDALDGHLESIENDDPLLASVFPALGATAEPSDDVSALVRYRLYRSVAQLLTRIARPAGLVLVLDDVHWADEATIEFLDHVSRHSPKARLMVVVAYRPKQAPPKLAVGGSRVPIGPLSEEEAGELLGPGVSRSRKKALYDASEGYPFYLQALARVEAGDLPGSKNDALALELRDLSGDALKVAQGAAVAADEFEAELAAVAAKVPIATALDALDELADRDLVRPVGGRFRFRHPLVRQAVYESTKPGWRLSAHQRIAERLAAVDAPAPLRAHHVERSASFGDRDAVDVLVNAARQVSTTAPATSAHWLQVALGLLPDSTDRLDLLLELARNQTVSGQLTEARTTAYEVLRLLPRDDYARRAQAARFCALVERLLDRPGEGRAVLVSELREIPEPRLPAALPMRLRLVAESLMRGDHRAAQAVLDFMPEDTDDPGLRLAIAMLRPMTAYAGHRVEEALRHVAAAQALADATPEIHQLAWMDTVAWMSWSEIWLGHHRPALARLERAIAAVKATGQTFILTNMLAGLGNLHGVFGSIPEGQVAAEESAEIALLLNSGYASVVALAQQSLLAGAAGDEEDAIRLGHAAATSGFSTTEWHGAQARYAYATALARAGRLDEQAIAAVEEAYTGDRLEEFSMLAFCETMAAAHAARSEAKEAADWAERAAGMVRPELEFTDGLARLARAHATLDTEAEELAVTAAEILTKAGRRYDAGRALLRAGTACVDGGRKRAALPYLEAACDIFTTCGARGLAATTIREQRRAGKRVAAARAAGAHGLTGRELEIARLVAEGCGNQQIADRLHISVRTVETHLTRAFEKLGVSSRGSLTATLAQLG
ncbi:helix-turn-helix transcriptional regulator [Herbidospora mongoliensis]|uniref:helix-turn-helix transcriptional regulator n=1 Tax=Herbidospora mongoliensis TaxID=688067 RepID=UPI0012FB7B0A|nr:AAA family ATPase [Herbidospora mongoliensis]